MIRISRRERPAMPDCVDLAELSDFLEALPEIREEIEKGGKIPKSNFSDGILNLSFEPGGRVRIGFEAQADHKGDRQ